MTRLTASQTISRVVDNGTWACWDTPLPLPAVDAAYAASIRRARQQAGTDEAVVTGAGQVGGKPVALIVGEFDFLGGSIGLATAHRIIDALRRATAERLPVMMLPVSGGTRMQEGTPAFVQMLRITESVNAHKAAHLPYLVYLRNPTTGGVFASWGSLGHVTLAEPGALVGFLGPRVFHALNGEAFPSGIQTSENLHAHGLIDDVVPIDGLANYLDRLLGLLTLPVAARVFSRNKLLQGNIDTGPAWNAVTASRDPKRHSVRELLDSAATELVELHGTGEGEFDNSTMLALTRIGGTACVLVGQDRRAQTPTGHLGPAALRTARRGMRLADELRLPLLTVIDTPGAALSKDAEERGLAGAIARCISDMLTLEVPTVAVLLGEGTGGAALALIAADTVIAAQHSWLAPLPPEGASAIMFGTTARAPEMASNQRIRAIDLLSDGLVDVIVSEEGGSDKENTGASFCLRMAASIETALEKQPAETYPSGTDLLLQRRRARLDSMGQVQLFA